MLQHYFIMTRAFFEHLGTDAETAFRHSFALAQPILDQYGHQDSLQRVSCHGTVHHRWQPASVDTAGTLSAAQSV